MIKKLAIFLGSALMFSAVALDINWLPDDLINWSNCRNIGENKAEVLQVTGIGTIEKKVQFRKRENRIFQLSILLSEDPEISPLTVAVVFQGGVAAGNRNWNHVIKAGDSFAGNTIVREITVPYDSTEVILKLMVDGKNCPTGIKSVRLNGIGVDSLKKRMVTLNADPAQIVSRPTGYHFGANVVGNFPGVYVGTLPADQPLSRRKDYIQFLRQAGLRSARYPGGTESHWFLPEGREISQKLFKMVHHRDAVNLVSLNDFSATMKEAGILVIYQVNTSFFLDDDGEIKAIDNTEFARRAKLDVSRPRYDAAAAAMERDFKNGVLTSDMVDYWEIGNEDFAYMTAAQYAKVCAALVPVIKKYDPGKPICITGMQGIESELMKYDGLFEMITGVTTHYPYARWPRPSPVYATADYDAFARADVNFSGSLKNKGKNGKKITVSETSVYNLFTFDYNRMQPAFALALALVRNWEQLLYNPDVDMAVFHDFESNYFGLTRYDAQLNFTSRSFSSIGNAVPLAKKTEAKDENWFVNPSAANSNVYFIKEYVPSPGSAAMSMLAEFADCRLLRKKVSSNFGFCGGCLIGIDRNDKWKVLVSNSLDIPVAAEIVIPDFPAKFRMRQIDCDYNGAILKNEYREYSEEISLINGRILLPARSVTLLCE